MLHSGGPVWTTTRGDARAARRLKILKEASMHYIIQLLAAILIGTAVGAVLSQRTQALLIGSVIAIVLGIVALVTASWIPLAVGVAVFLVVQGLQRDNYSTRA